MRATADHPEGYTTRERVWCETVPDLRGFDACVLEVEFSSRSRRGG